jgi:4-hydroxy-2-oxoglutarate aldolase
MSLTDQLSGLMLPVTTPFTATGDLDVRALIANIERWNATGINGYVMLGSTGERVHLNEDEYLKVIEATRKIVSSEHAFIVGAGQQSTRGTIDEVKKAAALGADAVLVLTPYFYRAAITHDTLVAHYTAIADSSPVPILLYSMPALTGIKIEPRTIASLSTHENIVGVKDSSADVEGLRATIDLAKGSRDFSVLTGNGTVFCDAMLAGAVGGILAVGCVAHELCLEIFQAIKNGDEERAQTLQEKLTPLAHAVTTRYGIGGLKAALDFVGYEGGGVRAPLRAPNDEARAEINHLLISLGRLSSQSS